MNVIRLEAYEPPAFRIERIWLELQLDADKTHACAWLWINSDKPVKQLTFDADWSNMLLEQIFLWPQEMVSCTDPFVVHSRNPLRFDSYQEEKSLRITWQDTKDAVVVQFVTRLLPGRNTALLGLYASGDGLFTQCEPEGFRRIIPFLDRPDVLSRYRVRLIADRARYPVLLANGNLIYEASHADGSHEAVWDDPFAKPSYLFAVVAGKLVAREEQITLADQRTALLQIWTAPHHYAQSGWALEALKAAIRWDETRFGLLLDLDRYMVVAVDDFNMGAMENKGLNLFNAKYVLVSPELSTDADYANVFAIIGHEYLHNWTGNRVTCRDWFQLTLKEGLTVFREQEFVADALAAAAGSKEARSARAIERIDEVIRLRALQFPEDAGPMRHPIRPRSYRAIENFYTATVYEKGAEVVRMLALLLGEEGFRKGLRAYLEAFDGQAVTCEDFVEALTKANGVDGIQFLHWYDAAGTPVVHASWKLLAPGEALLDLEQRLEEWPIEEKPLVIPIRIGLLDAACGKPLKLKLLEAPPLGTPWPAAVFELGAAYEELILVLDRPRASWRIAFEGNEAVPSLLRGFSAPVKLAFHGQAHQPVDALLCRLAHDPDPFNRYDAAEELWFQRVDALLKGQTLSWLERWEKSWRDALCDETLDPAFRARLLAVSPESILFSRMALPKDPVALRAAYLQLWRSVAQLPDSKQLWSLVDRYLPRMAYRFDFHLKGRRAFATLLLKLLALKGDEQLKAFLEKLWQESNAAATRLMVWEVAEHHPDPELGKSYAQRFHDAYRAYPLLLDQWMARLAARLPWHGEALEELFDAAWALTDHPHFTWRTPNRIYALLITLFQRNAAACIAAGARAWDAWSKAVIRLDRDNPIVAARLVRALEQLLDWKAEYQKELLATMHVLRLEVRSNEVCEVLDAVLNAPLHMCQPAKL